MKFFQHWEFDCHCNQGADCDAAPMDERFLDALERLRAEWGKPLSPTSARRCERHNTKVGGAPVSQHLYGRAVDFVFPNSIQARNFAYLAEKHGFTGIGLGEYLVHIDTRPARARWFYHS